MGKFTVTGLENKSFLSLELGKSRNWKLVLVSSVKHLSLLTEQQKQIHNCKQDCVANSKCNIREILLQNNE